MTSLIDIYLAIAWAIVIVTLLVALLAPSPKRRHTWGEIHSTDVASAERRRKRP